MSNFKVKICGVKSADIAYQIALQGVNYIGINFHASSQRRVDLSTASLIATAAMAGGAIPVAIFGEHTAKEIIGVCQITGINMVQLHGKISRLQYAELPEHLQRIYVLEVNEYGEFVNEEKPPELDKKRDVFLVDNQLKNSKAIKITNTLIDFTKQYPTFIAGGINLNNISDIMQNCQPFGIDICSGAENKNGEKSISKVRDLVKTLKMGDTQ